MTVPVATPQTLDGSVVDPAAVAAPGTTIAAGAADASIAPPGFVPVADLEKAQATARTLQGERDRLRADAEKRATAPVPVEGAATEAFDQAAFARSILSQVHGATALAAQAQGLRTEFVHADPALFTPEGMASFSSPEALRFAVEDSHKRVQTIVDAGVAAREAALRTELGLAAVEVTTPAGGPATTVGSAVAPYTAAQVAGMSIPEMNEVEKAHPGLIKRLLRG